MKDGQRFIVKVIKTEADLPKEKGKYIFGWDKTEINISEGISKLIFDPKDEESIHEYIEDYDWYFQPIEEQESISNEEIENYFTKEHYHYQKGRYTRVDKDRIFGAKFMRDHPEQFKNKRIASPFDKEDG